MTRYKGSNTYIKKLYHLPKVDILNLAEGNMVVYNLLDKGELLKLDIKYRHKASKHTLIRYLD